MYLQAHQRGWTLRLFGEFVLTDPAGETVTLANRKVEGLLAVLALNRDFGVCRDTLCDALWPERPRENQQSSLRQAVLNLRKTLGETAIESSRSHVRLTRFLPLSSDYERKELRNGSAFMPGHDGDWFQEIRLEESDDLVDPMEESGIGAAFAQTLRMLVQHDTEGMFFLMRSNAAVCRNIEYRQLNDLLDRVPPSDSNAGWLAYWRATAEDDLQASAAILRSSLRFAKNAQDHQLASEICLELGRAYSRLGYLEKAEKICDIADEVAERSGLRIAKANALRLRGTYYANWSQPVKGLAFLEQSEDFTEDTFTKVHLRAVRAFFGASLGHHRVAADLERVSSEMASKLGVTSAENLNGLTRAILIIEGGRPEDSVFELERIRVRSNQSGSIQTEVYADEMLAKVFLIGGDKSLAMQRSTSARKGRQVTLMVPTALESQRINRLR